MSSTGLSLVIPAIATLLKIVKWLLDVREEHFFRGHLKRLAFLARKISTSSEMKELVLAAQEEEAFKFIYGKNVSPSFRKAFRSTFSTGLFTFKELRIAKPYIEYEPGGLKINIGILGWLTLIVSLLAVISMGVFAWAIAYALFNLNSMRGLAGGVGALAFYFFFSWYFGKDARAVIVAKQVKDKLTAFEQRPETSDVHTA